MAAEKLDELGAPKEQTCLGTAEQLVSTTGHEVGTVGQSRCGIRLLGQKRIRRQEAAADVDHDRHSETRETGELGDGHRGGEALDAEVARMHLEDTARVRSDRVGVVAQRGAVGGADLAEPSTRRCDQVGQAETVTDLDHLTAADDDLPPGREGGRREHESGRAVVDHQHVTGRGHRFTQRVQGAAASAGSRAGSDIELHVDVCRGRHHRLDRRRRQWGATDVGVQHDPGGVENRSQRRRGAGEPGHRLVGNCVRCDLALAGALLSPADSLLDRGGAHADCGINQPGVAEHRVGAWHDATRIRHTDGRELSHPAIL